MGGVTMTSLLSSIRMCGGDGSTRFAVLSLFEKRTRSYHLQSSINYGRSNEYSTCSSLVARCDWFPCAIHVQQQITHALKHLASRSVQPVGLLMGVLPCSRGMKIKTTNISFRGLRGNSAKLCTGKNFLLHGNLSVANIDIVSMVNTCSTHMQVHCSSSCLTCMYSIYQSNCSKWDWRVKQQPHWRFNKCSRGGSISASSNSRKI